MSSTKENFNKAVFEMFGVGNQPAETESVQQKSVTPAAEATAAPIAQPAAAVPQAAPAAIPVTYLAPGTSMEGTLSAKGDVEVAGSFKGDISAEGRVILHSSIHGNITAAQLDIKGCHLVGDVHTSGMVFVDNSSSIEGNVYASELVCSGTIKGNLTVSANTSLQNGSHVEGSITTGTIIIERGAVVSGELRMGDGKK